MITGRIGIETARMLWEQCEGQLYATAVSDPTRYQQIVMAVRAMSDELRSSESIEQLMQMWPPTTEMVESVRAACGLPAGTLPWDQISGAAFAFREREIRAQAQREARQNRINAARQAGNAWALLAESGKLDAGLIDPYRCTEMHVASGLAVFSQVQPEPDHGAPMFIVSVVKLDPLTGELLDAAPGIEDWAEHARVEEFLAHRQAIRDRIGSQSTRDAE